MIVTHSIADTRARCRSLRSAATDTLAVVPTMGALHAGHLSLVRAARRRAERVAVTLFVNPLQFAPSEDLDRYPRTFEADRQLLESEGVDLLFAPDPAEIYPATYANTAVDPGPLGDRLDGLSRPGHFRGVATVVVKLFNIIGPDFAFFGQKDAAQVAVLRSVVRDLDLPVQLHVEPTLREADGLALSSRNRYLSATERTAALAIPQALFAAQASVRDGQLDPAAVLEAIRHHLAAAGLRIDYTEAVDPGTLLPTPTLAPGTLLAVAAWAGSTRLIDNVLL